MVLQAYIDDSKTREDVLVLAGYLAPWEKWARFSVEWDLLMKEFPAWDEFKMKKAIRLPDRGERFYRLVEKYVTAFVVCVVDIQALRRLCDELGLDDFHRNPYHYGFRALTDVTYQQLHLLGLDDDKIEFICDKRGEQKFIDLGWSWYEASIAEEIRLRIAGKPRFEDSVEFRPLQAAEIIAWNARKHWLKHGHVDDPIELPWPQKRPIPGHKVCWDYKGIKPNLERIRDVLKDLEAIPIGKPSGFSIVIMKITFSDVDFSDPEA
jgi:hypothetical protein